MDKISIAIERARRQRQNNAPLPYNATSPRPVAVTPNGKAGPDNGSAVGKANFDIAALQLDLNKLEDSRLVSYLRRHPSHAAFDMLRTKITHSMASHGWTSIGITSPSPGCGKSMVALNLAFSMAHQPDWAVALVDLDLRAPRIAEMVGHNPVHAFSDYLEGNVEFSALCRRVGKNLILGFNGKPVARSAEWMRNDKTNGLPALLKDVLGAKIVIFDLPPALTTDDVMVFCPYVDCVMLVAAAGKTTAREIEEAERQLTLSNYLGVVLNMAFGSDVKAYSDEAAKRQS
jgi:protein-tyrosine kinase